MLKRIIAILVFSALALPAWALPDGHTPPSMTSMAASFAKARAQMRAYGVDARYLGPDEDLYAIGTKDRYGCQLNVGNVFLTEDDYPIRDVSIFIQGDIIQAGGCR